MTQLEGANLGALSDLCTPWCIHVVATLRISDHIAAGINQIDNLAAAAGCDPYALHRVLTHLVGQGVFEEPTPGQFILNEAARGLLDPGECLGLDLNGIGSRMAYAWGTLLSYVRTGQPAYHEVFGLPFWEDLDAHPETAASFDALIGPVGHGTPNPAFQITGGWEAVRTVVDARGGPAYPAQDPWHASRSPENRGSFRRDFPGCWRGRAGHDGRAELLRSTTGRGGPLSAEGGAERLA
jgi:hypothetical protein